LLTISLRIATPDVSGACRSGALSSRSTMSHPRSRFA
jgi:hypothetical protein